jgi:hypothetical protein
MVPTFKSETLITDLYSMNPPDSRAGITFLPPYTKGALKAKSALNTKAALKAKSALKKMSALKTTSALKA